LRPAPRHRRQPARIPTGPRHLRPGEARPGRVPRVLTALLLLTALVGALTVSARAFPPFGAQGNEALTPKAAWLGAWVQPSGAFTRTAQQQAVLDLERRIGRRLAIDHTYVPFGAQLGWRPAWDVELGRIPLITIGNGASTAEVAQGRHDVYLRQLAEGVRSLGKPVYLRYAHRMDDPRNSAWVGSPEHYVAAWRHVREIFAGLPASFVWSPTAAAFASDAADRFYPGDDQVDWIAADGYNDPGCRSQTRWRELSEIFGDFYVWGSSHGKPLMIGETGSVEDAGDAGRKAAWFDNAARDLTTEMPNVQALIYFDARKACDYRVASSSRSLEGFRRLALDPHFQTTPLPPTSTTATTTTRPTSSTRPPSSTTPATTSPGGGGGSPGPDGFNRIMVPNSGALWGTSKFDKSWESQMGRKFDIVHVYHQWTQNFPTAEERALAAEGRLLLINWKSPGSWPAVANGSQDGQITATATRLKAFGRKLFLAFHPEPENDIGAAGQPADYARAFRRVVDVFNKVGADNVIFVWNMMGFVGGHGDIYPTLYPGDQYVDWIAYDPYNWYGCKSGHKTRSFAEITKPFYDWTAAHAPDKPLMLAEYGLREQPASSTSKADWFRDELTQLKTTRTRLKALVYFNNDHKCDWRITSSSSSVAAYREIGRDGFLNRLH
jgi:beta-mannanase